MMRAFTFLRLTQEMLQPSYQATWLRFMHRMRHNSVRGATPQSGASRTSTGLRPLTPLNQRSVEESFASPPFRAFFTPMCVTALRTHPAAMVVMVYVLCFELWKVIWARHWLAAVPAFRAEVHGGF